ncbi:hypothetical protein AGOR_G00079740 [Albula goreensis]|uniref:Uncharacterized protein n=1 Tax=Albula goreensis TaxID=1534307 RepID=A0A8T3DHX3_9TELE|nr:hypothetical protein AGOR_G00079740 [Albula goreensis]
MAAPWCWEIESINETFKRLFERRSPVLQEELGLGRTWRSATRKFVVEGGNVEWAAEFNLSGVMSQEPQAMCRTFRKKVRILTQERALTYFGDFPLIQYPPAHPSDSGTRAGKQSPSLKDGRAPLTPLLSSLGPVFLQALIAFCIFSLPSSKPETEKISSY